MTNHRLFTRLFTLLVLTGAAVTVRAQATLTVQGEVDKPLTLQATDLAAMPHVDVTAKDHDEKKHRFSGVPLVEVLRQAGVTLGGKLRGPNLGKYVLLTAADGYQVVFALPELDPEFTDRQILLVDKMDGKPLPTDAGPLRVVVPDEKKHARWIRQVTAIRVNKAN
ncbi:molybdopterin-binding protein [Fibrisoma montanum]|uniref:Molybdopterin-binding protein n=1 Tax=Fibrisoma montanum TaxID=2305895 RepID=A0A418MHV5_9BACT|nr:molybdopterin-dependent oxidoreductase [Fibrisoma montanum]RIV27006.1 molybdopterin-binding protein [Fibrisoma montanum]